MAYDLVKTTFQTAIHEVEIYGLILMDLDGKIATWNRGAEQLLGYKEKEVLHRHFEFIFTAGDRDLGVPLREMQTALRTGHAYDDRWHVRKDGTEIFVHGGLCLLKSETGDPFGFVKIIRDQTERKEHLSKIEDLNARLIQAHREMENYANTLETKVSDRTLALNERNRELQDFCYSIAHDLRGPLRSIQAMAEVVLEDYDRVLDAKGKDYLGRISQAGKQLDHLTLDLLAYTRLSREEIEMTSVGLGEVIDEVLLNLGESIVREQALVEVQRPLPSVRGQQAYLVQIVGNLLSNSLKFAAPDRSPIIQIWSEIKEGRVRVYVKDNGIGVPPEFHDKIFLLFERLDPHGGVEGTGAGLAIARKAAQRLGGEIGLGEAGPKGSVFWLELELAR